MEFKRFAEFMKERLDEESSANKDAMAFDTKIAAFHARFPDGDGEKIIKASGYKSIRDFLHDPDERKWTRLRIPGQGNYIR